MPIQLIPIKHKKTGALSNAPVTQLERYKANGWEPVKNAEAVTSPLTAATPVVAESGKKESER